MLATALRIATGFVVAVGVTISSGHGVASADSVRYGDPVGAAYYWQPQSLQDNCGLMAVADVVGEISDDEPTEAQMVILAQQTPSQYDPPNLIYSAGKWGTYMIDQVVLLDHFGITAAKVDGSVTPEQTGLPMLEQYLTDDRKVIAWVNSETISGTGTDPSAKADHFVVVTGIDANKEIVHLNNPAADDGDQHVPFATFMKAWDAGRNSIVVTAAAS